MSSLLSWWRFARQVFMRLLFVLAYSPVGQAARRLLGKRIVSSVRPTGWDEQRLNFFRASIQHSDSLERSAPSQDQLKDGLNVIGYIFSETGVGEVARNALRALQAQQYPVAYTNLHGFDPARQQDKSCAHFAVGHPYGINLFYTNAEQAFGVLQALGPQFFSNRRNIGYWFWEVTPFPKIWADRFELFSEIWVASDFVQEVIGRAAPIPVVKVPPALEPEVRPGVTRQSLRLPEDKFVFMFAFDGLGGYDRKNPLGVVEAYRRAFGKQAGKTALVIKANNLNASFHTNGSAPEFERNRLVSAIENVSGLLIEEYFDRQTTNALYNLCDCFVSLHRSEGFGLSLAEAMALGKPCIATGYSGNLEFMQPEHSYLANYQLVSLEQDYGPYSAGSQWAEPDLDHAAQLMLDVFQQREESADKGARASRFIRHNYSFAAAGARLIHQLQQAG